MSSQPAFGTYQPLLSEVERQALITRVRGRLDSEDTRRAEAGHAPITTENARLFAAAQITNEMREWETRQIASRFEAPDPARVEAEIRSLVESGFGLGGLEQLLADPNIEEIWVNGCDVVHVRTGTGERKQVGAVCGTDSELVDMIQMLAAREGRTERSWSTAYPFLDLRLGDGSRLNAVREVSGRPSVTIRRQRHRQVTLADLVGLGTMSAVCAEFLRAAVKAKLNVIVAGGTSTGKTTFLRALLHQVGPTERLVTIEDTLELHLSDTPSQHPNVVELETRPANTSGEGEVNLEDLCRNALRMAPDRLIVGEVRGAEAVSMLSAMSAGMDGSACTIHADSASQTAEKVALYCGRGDNSLGHEQALRLFAMSVDLVVHLRQVDTPERGPTRQITEILEVTHFDAGVKTNRVFTQPNRAGLAEPTGALSDGLRQRLDTVGFDAAALAGNPVHAGNPALAGTPAVGGRHR